MFKELLAVVGCRGLEIRKLKGCGGYVSVACVRFRVQA